MPRTTAPRVEAIMQLASTFTDSQIDSFITAANEVVTEVLGDDTTLSDKLKREIETWLAAHLIAMTPHGRQATTERLGDARIDYAGKFGEGLKQTTYGQTVLTLDVTGKMASFGTGVKRAYINSIEAWDHGDG